MIFDYTGTMISFFKPKISIQKDNLHINKVLMYTKGIKSILSTLLNPDYILAY